MSAPPPRHPVLLTRVEWIVFGAVLAAQWQPDAQAAAIRDEILTQVAQIAAPRRPRQLELGQTAAEALACIAILGLCVVAAILGLRGGA